LFLTGHSELFEVIDASGKIKIKRIYTIPRRSILTDLYQNYLNFLQTSGYYRLIQNRFSDDFLSDLIISEGPKRIHGPTDFILSGKQELLRIVSDTFSSILEGKNIPELFPEKIDILDIKASRKVMQHYLTLYFLHYLYFLARYKEQSSAIDRDYIKLIRQMIYDQVSGTLTFGVHGSKNPLLYVKKDDPLTGFKVPFYLDYLTPEKLISILSTLDYSAVMGPEKEAEYLSLLNIKNIKDRIKASFKKTYDVLYNILWNFEDEHGNLVNKFYISLYGITPTGIKIGKSGLKNTVPDKFVGADIKPGSRIVISLDRNDPESVVEFRRKVASTVKLIIKYNAIASVKVEYSTPKSGLFISQFGILSEEYMKSAFTGPALNVELTEYARQNYELWRAIYADTWSLENIFPIYLFKGDFDQWVIELFKDLSTYYYIEDNRYDGIDQLYSTQH